jgi:glycosyltransferase involved in cell wall biosynthesis
MDINLGVVISTYMRKDGTTPFFLKRALDSVINQTYDNFKIFLVGDRYENENEINSIVLQYPSQKIFFINLPEALERDNYKDKWAIWSYGGVNAINYGIETALKEGFEFICHLDHDDYWDSSHLNEFSKCIKNTKSDWMCTKSKYVSNMIYPNFNCTSEYCSYKPMARGLIHSSVCMNFRNIPLRYQDLYKLTNKIGDPADADLWTRVADFTTKNNLKTTLINKVTCYHLEEGYERR